MKKNAKQTKTVSGGFLCILFICVMGVAGFCYQGERRFIENSTSITAKIVRVKAVPRVRILHLETENTKIAGPDLTIAVPFWDSRKTGERLNIRIGHGGDAGIRVDESFFLYSTSIGILAGCSLLMIIVFGVLFFKKTP